ncbi:MAG: alpha/beta hydrolase [Gemmatimonadota bacterium]
MDCASGASRNRMARIRAESSMSTLGAMSNVWFPEVCRTVPEARLPDDFRVEFTSTVPTLSLSGTLDSNTPPYQAHHAAWGWAAATHIVAEGAGHETLMPFAPVQGVIVEFFRGEDVRGRRIDVPEVDFLGVAEALRRMGACALWTFRIGPARRPRPGVGLPRGKSAGRVTTQRDRSTSAWRARVSGEGPTPNSWEINSRHRS